MKYKMRLLVVLCLVFGAGVMADTVWTGGGGNTLVGNVSNWSEGLPSSSNLGTVGDGITVSYTGVNDLDNMYITFNGSSSLTGVQARANGGHLVFNGTSSFVPGNNGGIRLYSGQTVTLNDSSELDFGTGDPVAFYGAGTLNLNSSVDQSVRMLFDSGTGGVFNHNSGATFSVNRNLVFNDSGAGNVYNLADGKFSSGSFGGGMVLTGNNYINFTAGSTGIIEQRGLDFGVTFTNLVNSGNIRINGAAATLDDFDINYDGADTTIIIPEPATLGLVTSIGVAIFFIRRLSI